MKLEWVYKNGHFDKRDLEHVKTLSEGMVRIRPTEVGICGSDLYSMEVLPSDKELRPGHEWIGVVEESFSDKFKAGDIVTSPVSFGCQNCKSCLDGKPNNCLNNTALGGQEIGAIRNELVLKDEDLISLEGLDQQGLVLIEVAAVAEQAFIHMNDMGLEKEEDSKILIFGGGPVGLFCALKAKKQNLDYTLIEIDKNRIEVAKKLGLNVIATGAALLDERYSMSFDFIFDCSGDGNGRSGFWKYLLHFSNVSAKLLVVGKYINQQSFNSVLYTNRDITIKWMRGLPKSVILKAKEEWSKDLKEIGSHMITQEYSVKDINVAFDKALKRDGTCKVVIKI